MEAELVFLREGREVERTVLKGPLSPGGSHAKCNGVQVDAVEIRFLRLRGGAPGSVQAGLAEVETIAKLVED